MNTPDPLTELRNYVAGQVVASEKAISYINQLHEEREKLLKALAAVDGIAWQLSMDCNALMIGAGLLSSEKSFLAMEQAAKNSATSIRQTIEETRRATP